MSVMLQLRGSQRGKYRACQLVECHSTIDVIAYRSETLQSAQQGHEGHSHGHRFRTTLPAPHWVISS